VVYDDNLTENLFLNKAPAVFHHVILIGLVNQAKITTFYHN